MKKKKLFLLVILIFCATFLICGCDESQPGNDVESYSDETHFYSIPEAYFSLEKYNVITKSSDNVGEGFSVITSNTLELEVKCGALLNEVIAYIKMYDADGKLVGSYRCSLKNCNIEANESFVLSTEISNDAKNNFSVIDVKFEGKSSRKIFMAEHIMYNVTWVYNNGDASKMETFELGSKIEEPSEEPQKDGYVFDGWFTDQACTEKYDFENSEVDENITLYAGYVFDYAKVEQKLVDVAKLSTVKVITKSYSSFFWSKIETASSTKCGEGIIIDDGNGRYSVLTTNDILKKENGYEKVEYTVVDYYGNTISAELKHSSEAYNLGVLQFERTSALLVVPLASSSPMIGDDIAMSNWNENDEYQLHFGKVLSFERIEHNGSGSLARDVSYDMLVHSAESDVRVSGRPMFNMNFELVGIQCGTLTDEKIELDKNHVIPWATIQKYMNSYGI